MQSIKNCPEAFELMDSLRSIGYSFESAICDIIDNSISASASKIWLFIPNSPRETFVEILDDGEGMSSDELFTAMKYGGEKNKSRKISDLGRFGLGLKSASLSQCKILTVVSKKSGVTSAFRWDEDYISKTKDWNLLSLSQEEISELTNIEKLDNLKTGTLVIWENLDILLKKAGIGAYSSLCMQMQSCEKMICLVYHKFMDPNYHQPSKKVAFFINYKPLKYLDPFLISKSGTSRERPAIIDERDTSGNIQKIICAPFILPFQKRLSDEEEELVGGADNMFKMQGFYIYRNYRLISWGSWFGMRPAKELAKYARIMVDVPSALDDKWGIDVKKEKAEIPLEVKKQLRKTVDSVCDSSTKRISRRTLPDEKDPKRLWEISHDRENRKIFIVNKEAPLISDFKNSLEPRQIETLDFILDSLSATLSYVDIYSIYSQGNHEPQTLEMLNEAPQKILDEAIQMVNHFLACSFQKEEAIEMVCSTQPFSSIPGFAGILKEKEKEKEK